MAVAWPLAAPAQQPDGIRRIGVLLGYDENDRAAQSWTTALKQGLQKLGWSERRKIKIEVRWAAGKADRRQMFAKELVDLQNEVIVAGATPEVAALLRETRTIPIVFTSSADPVGSGFVSSIARPGGNVTGFSSNQASLATKWLQLLKEASPSLLRVAVVFNPDMAASGGSLFLRPLEQVAPSLGLKLIPSPVRDRSGIERALAVVAREPGGGLLVPPDPFVISQRDLIIATAAHRKLPAIYSFDV